MANNVQASGLEELTAQVKEQGEALAKLCEALCTLTAEVTRLREAQSSVPVTPEQYRLVKEERNRYRAALETLDALPLIVRPEALARGGDGESFRQLIAELERDYGDAK